MLVLKRTFFVSGTATPVISNKEVGDIMRIVKSVKESGTFSKDASEAIKNETKEQKCVFLGMLLGKLDAILSGSILAVKGVIRAIEATNRPCTN